MKSDLAYDRIAKMIVNLELAPGSPINDDELGQLLGVGRTPVREALQRLVADRLVVIMPRRGTVVADLHLDDLRQFYEVRLVLESLSAELAARRATDEQIADLERLVAQSDAAIAAGDFLRMTEVDHELHLSIAKIANNSYLEDQIRRLHLHSFRVLRYSHTVMGPKDSAMPGEWRAVVQAIRERNQEQAAKAMRQHVTQARSEALLLI